MSDPLATYLHDHLAGAVHAIALVEAIRDQHSEQPLGRFAANLLIEIKEDSDVLCGGWGTRRSQIPGSPHT
jgi:hypothetical protein